MRKINIIVIVVFSFLFFQNCKKEDRILKKLVGTWNVTEYKRGGGYTKTDFSADVTTFQFMSHKKAYTATMKAVYRIDYVDPSKVDMIDTFKFQMKGNELDITSIQKSVNTKFLKRRFKIEEYKDNKLKLVRVDSTDLYIKATK